MPAIRFYTMKDNETTISANRVIGFSYLYPVFDDDGYRVLLRVEEHGRSREYTLLDTNHERLAIRFFLALIGSFLNRECDTDLRDLQREYMADWYDQHQYVLYGGLWEPSVELVRGDSWTILSWLEPRASWARSTLRRSLSKPTELGFVRESYASDDDPIDVVYGADTCWEKQDDGTYTDDTGEIWIPYCIKLERVH